MAWDNYRPVTSGEYYWERIARALEELVALKKGGDQAAAADTDAAGLTLLRETEAPAEQVAPATPLPADFPGREALAAAGIVALENVPRAGQQLTAIPGIGAVTANRILTWFKR
jgi:hypothetical protein